MASLPTSSPVERLTPRQNELLRLVCRGLSDLEIAELLGISRHTVRNTLTDAYRRLADAGCSSAGANHKAAWYCYLLGLDDGRRIPPDPSSTVTRPDEV